MTSQRLFEAKQVNELSDQQKQRVQNLLDDLRLSKPTIFTLFQSIRELILKQFPGIEEKVMYGGILFSDPSAFCGLFAYKAHVSVEFSEGAQLDDPKGTLEGKGKFRRHLKFTSLAEVADKNLIGFLNQARDRQLP